jgi:hypothetical protein
MKPDSEQSGDEQAKYREGVVNFNMKRRRMLYALLGVGIAVASIGIFFLFNHPF